MNKKQYNLDAITIKILKKLNKKIDTFLRGSLAIDLLTDSNYRITNDIDLVSDNKNINFRKIFEKEFPYFEKNTLDQNFLKGKILDKKIEIINSLYINKRNTIKIKGIKVANIQYVLISKMVQLPFLFSNQQSVKKIENTILDIEFIIKYINQKNLKLQNLELLYLVKQNLVSDYSLKLFFKQNNFSQFINNEINEKEKNKNKNKNE
ncbi:hypothetical protein [Mycoplasmopsis synoviae]|uniref:hypothetical protein n=1 Tax=Mycoplasmopsis synoviae TaxID=2109 RepID=UPI0034DAC201